MDDKLRKRLLATFKIEAEEHLSSIRNGLVKLEGLESEEEKISLLEEIYRDAHSLKGAARAVNLTDIVDLCQNVENIFSALKKGEIKESDELFELVQNSLAVIEGFINEEDENNRILMYDDIQQYQVLIDDFLEQSKQEPEGEVLHPEVVPPKMADETFGKREEKVQKKKEDSPQNAAKIKEEGKVNLPRKGKREIRELKESDTVRVQISQLENTLLNVEELIPVKLAFQKLSKELSGLLLMIDHWRSKWYGGKIDYITLKERLTEIGKEAGLTKELQKISEFLNFNEIFASDFYELLNDIQLRTQATVKRFSNTLYDLNSEVKNTLMLPFGYLTEQFPTMVWDIAKELGKKIKFEIKGDNLQVDKRILEGLKDPLVHILRNAIDHGIEYPEERIKAGKEEKGKISLEFAQSEDGKINIVITDDGKGLDTEQIKGTAISRGIISEEEADKLNENQIRSLIFKSDFSTAKVVTELSGRGLGMAIVEEKINKLEGTIKVDSEKGKGTKITLTVPIVLSSVRGLLIETGGQKFAINIGQITSVIRRKKEEILTVENRETIEYSGKRVPIVNLASVLKLTVATEEKEELLLLVFSAENNYLAVSIDKLLEEEEMLIKPLPPQFKNLAFVESATILPQGEIVPILKISDIFKAVKKGVDSVYFVKEKKDAKKRKKILVVDDSVTSRVLISDILSSVGYDVTSASDGKEAWTELQQKDFDLVVTDVEMPRMNGFELTKKIRQSSDFPDLPVVLVTGLSKREDKEKGIEAGANAYIVKSDFEQGTLLEIIRKYV